MLRYFFSLVVLFSCSGIAVAQSGLQSSSAAGYMALTSHEVNMRVGPGTEYPVTWVYQRRHLPFEVVDEVDAGWVHLRAHDGEEGWITRDLLTTRRTFRVQSYRTEVHRRPEEGSRITAYLSEGVVGELRACQGDWCQISLADTRGWVKRENLWGVGRNENFE